MLFEDALKIVKDRIVFGLRHDHYDRTIEVADFSKILVTGKHQGDFLVSIKSRENDAQKDQRIKLTNSYTKLAANQVVSTYKKPRRNTDVDRVVRFKTENNTKKIEGKLSKFSANKSFSKYLLDNVIDHDIHVDANTFYVLLSKYDRGDDQEITNTRFKCVRVASCDVVDYVKDLDHMVWFIHSIDRTEYLTKQDGKDIIGTAAKTKEYKDYYYYDDEISIELKHVDPKKIPPLKDDQKTVTWANNTYIVTKYNLYGEGKHHICPVISTAGAFPDFETEGSTSVTSIEPCFEVGKDLIRDKSFFDLTKTLHTFLQKIQYARPCTHEDPQKGQCVRGYYGGTQQENMTCSSCHGTGESYHRSEQDVIRIKAPDDFKDIIDVDRLIKYVNLPHETPRFQDEQVDKMIRRFFFAAFSSEKNLQGDFSKTATENNIEAEKVSDVLIKPYEHVAYMWELGVMIMAGYMEIYDDIEEIKYRYPKELKIKTTQTLISELKAAKESSASFEVSFGIQCDLIERMYPDNPDMVKRIKVQKAHIPWHSKSTDERTIIMANRKLDDYDRVLYENEETIFSDIYDENPKFYLLDYSKRKGIISEKVNKIIEAIPPETTPGPLIISLEEDESEPII